MESKFFKWENWDILDTAVFTFYDITLRVQVGQFPEGTRFSEATMDYDQGVMQLRNYGDPEDSSGDYYEFALTMTATQKEKE